jgi:predicted thioesterase
VKRRSAALCLVVLLAWAAPVLAQRSAKEAPPDRRPFIIAEIVAGAKAAVDKKIPTPFALQIGQGNRQLIAAYLMAAHSERAVYAALLKALEASRVDKQIGSPPNANGGTSLAMKGLAPRIFGFAVERGALTEDISGTTVTFRASPVGLLKALQGSSLIDLNDDYIRSSGQRLWGRFSVAATFDVSRGTQPGVFTGSDQQLASWAARVTLINRRDPASPEYAAQWQALVQMSDSTTRYRTSVRTLNDALGQWTAYTQWENDLTAVVESTIEKKPLTTSGDVDAAVAAYSALLTDRLKKLETLPMPADVTTALDAYAAELGRVQSSIEQIYAFAAKGPLVTFDSTTTRDQALPDLYTWTGVFEAALGASRKTDLTVNGSVSTYTSTPTGAAQAMKSINLVAQLERPLGNGMPAPILTFAVRYSYLPNDTVSSTGEELVGVGTALQGHVASFQGKVTIPIKDSGAKVPISVTAANRTELIQEKNVRGSIGITFDMDTFMSALTSFVR